jgi:hypothetical protein
MRITLFSLLATVLSTSNIFASDLVVRSGPGRTHLIELYTSEGCSSCPPAEEQFSNFKSNPGLWTQIVPVAFHVDYWDGLGWPDRFASPAFTQRQRDYASEWGSDSVYTPELVLDGSEFHGGAIPSALDPAGILTATLNPTGVLSIRYAPNPQDAGAKWEAHIATLGMGIESDVRAGENGGRRLQHDFLALHLTSHRLDNSGTVTLPLPADSAKAIAIWITRAGESTPVQAAGSWLQ